MLDKNSAVSESGNWLIKKDITSTSIDRSSCTMNNCKLQQRYSFVELKTRIHV